MKKILFFLSIIFFSVFILVGLAKADEDSWSLGGLQCNDNGPKECNSAIDVRQGEHQMWKARITFQHSSRGSQSDARADICFSRDSSMWNSDDLCWTIRNYVNTSFSGSTTATHDLSESMWDYMKDYDYLVLKVSIDNADTTTTRDLWSRRVDANSINFSKINSSADISSVVINQPFDIEWSVDWPYGGNMGAYLKSHGGAWIREVVPAGNTSSTENGTYAGDSGNGVTEDSAGTFTYNLCANGPGVSSSDPGGGSGDSGNGPPWEAFLPGGISFAAVDGMEVCKSATLTVDKGATLRTTPLADNDNNTAEYTFNAVQGGSDPANQTLTIKNNTLSPDRDLSWKADISYTSGNGWLSLQSTQGNVEAGNTVDKNVSADVSGLSAGTYKAKITITGCSNGTDSTGGGCNANTISNGQYAQADDYNPLTLNVTFVVGNSGTVNVTSNVNNTEFGFGGGGAFGGCPSMTDLDIGETWTCNTVDAGTHTIAPVGKSGYTVSVSPSATQTLSSGGNITYNITYTATGTISVSSNKNTDWNIDGPGSNDFSATNDNSQNYNDVPLGDYTISGVPTSLIADSGKWFTLDSITPDTTQTLSSSGQTKTFTIDYQQSQPVCSPATQTRQAGTAASFTATGGDGVFSWSAPGGSITTGTGSSFSTTYSTTGSKTVTLTSNQGQTDTCSVTVTSAPPPTVDLDADGSDGPISIAYNGSATLSWISAETDTCTASGGWSGAKATSGSESSGNLTSDTTYTLTCDGPGGQASDSVTVSVLGLPTLSVGLIANPSTGSAPLSSVLTASVGGTAVGTINYSFWWNCSDVSNNVATVEGVCGTLPVPGAGSCLSNAVGYKCNGVNTNPQSAPAYSYNSSSTGKVIVERDIATPAEARASITISSPPPSASGVIVTPPNYCVSGPAATVSWTYSDPLGSPQSAYQVQIDNNASFVSPEVDSGKILSGSTAYFSGSGILQFNTNYNVRVMVWNSSDTPSAWSSTVGFSTPNYAYPQVDFSFSPTNPPISEPVQFTDQTVFDAPGPTTWSWLFGDAGSSTLQNPTHTYVTEGSYGATLTATDNAGQACSLTKTVNIQKAIPVWKEVAPR